MNQAQGVFVASIVLPFVVLVVLQRALSSSLNAAGIHFSDLILIGLPKDVNNPEMGSHTFEELVVSTKAYLHAFDVPGVGTVDVLSPPFIGTVAVLLAAFVWTTLLQKSTYPFSVCYRTTYPVQAGPRFWTPQNGRPSHSRKRSKYPRTPPSTASPCPQVPPSSASPLASTFRSLLKSMARM